MRRGSVPRRVKNFYFTVADLEANGGTFPDNTTTSVIEITGDSKSATGITIGGDASSYKRKGVDASDYLRDSIIENYTFNSSIQAKVTLQGRKVIGCVYCDNSTSTLPAISVTAYQGGTYSWDDKNHEGMIGGQIFGTSSKLAYAVSGT